MIEQEDRCPWRESPLPSPSPLPPHRIKVTRSNRRRIRIPVWNKKRELKWNEGDVEEAPSRYPIPPPRRWRGVSIYLPFCPANKRDNFSNLNRTPFESTRLERVGQPRLPPITWGRETNLSACKARYNAFQSPSRKGGVCLGKGEQWSRFYIPLYPFFTNLESEYGSNMFEEVWWYENVYYCWFECDVSSSLKWKEEFLLFAFIYFFLIWFDSLKKLKLVLLRVWWSFCFCFYLKKKVLGINGVFVETIRNF